MTLYTWGDVMKKGHAAFAVFILFMLGLNFYVNKKPKPVEEIPPPPPKQQIVRKENKPIAAVMPDLFSYNKAYKDFHEGRFDTLFKECESTSDPRAKTILAECYWRGLGVEKSRVKAEEYFHDALNGGDMDAYAVLGNLMIKNGELYRGFSFCEISAENGGPLGYLICALGYNTGAWGQVRDEQKAVDYFARAFDGFYNRAMQNELDACYMMSEFYRNGWGVMRDQSREKYWLRRADEISETGTYKEKS